MIDLYYWPTPNGWKVSIMLEECDLEYKVVAVDIGGGDQFKPEFLRICPNNRMPAIIDHAPTDGKKPISVFESGAILLYLAGKTGKFIPKDLRGQVECTEWLFWQMGGLGPMAGQNHHFVQYAPEKLPYAMDRYVNETSRLYGVLNKHLADGRDYICGDYSIADMAAYPWVVPHERQRQDMNNFPALNQWRERISVRPATRKAYDLAKSINIAPTVDEKSKSILFGQDAKTIR